MGLRMYKDVYLDGGEFKDALDIERGRMLFHAEEEWRRRNMAYFWRGHRWVVIILLCLASLLSVFFYYMYTLYSDPWAELLYLLWPIYITGLLVLGTWNRVHNIKSSPTQGMYENGVQSTYWRFIPYSEIVRVERVSVKRREPDWIKLHLTTPEPWDHVWAPIAYFGKEGAEELERRVGEAKRDTEEDA